MELDTDATFQVNDQLTLVIHLSVEMDSPNKVLFRTQYER